MVLSTTQPLPFRSGTVLHGEDLSEGSAAQDLPLLPGVDAPHVRVLPAGLGCRRVYVRKGRRRWEENKGVFEVSLLEVEEEN